MAIVEAESIDRVLMVPVEIATPARPVQALDAIRFSEDLVSRIGLLLRDRLLLAEVPVANFIANVALVDVARVADALLQTRDVELLEAIGIELVQQTQHAIRIIESLRLPSTLEARAAYGMPVVEGLRIVAALGQFFGADAADALVASDTPIAKQLLRPVLSDGVGVAEAIAPHLFLNVVCHDTLLIDPADIVQAIFSPEVVEGIAVQAGYLAPNGSFTTWAMNTRTAAVTEYADYAFNSFARIGTRYLGASDSGLYDLFGDDDDGADIVARIKGGFLQFGGTQLSRLKEAYIAARGGGDFVLRIITGDGVIYNYGITAANLRSSKFNMGKGQRARYFAYELISAGQDFDLDTLEFVPLVVQRRV